MLKFNYLKENKICVLYKNQSTSYRYLDRASMQMYHYREMNPIKSPIHHYCKRKKNDYIYEYIFFLLNYK